MLLFFISLICVFGTSFFVTAVLEKNRFITALIYFLTTAFANVVITLEFLSLFSAISQTGVLLLNILFLILSIGLWNRLGRPVFDFDLKRPLKVLFNALKKDKYLAVLALCFVFMCAVSLWLISFMPVVNPDAEGYHVLRSLFWIQNHNLNHFDIAEVRCLDLPINSEILYAWVLLFVKKCVWFGIFSFSGFVLSLAALWGILSNIGFSTRRKLWVIFITASFSSVIVQISGTETDIIIAGLVLSSIYLYWNSLKTDKNKQLFMSALCYALAVGTKTPALMLVPGTGMLMTAAAVYYKKKEFYKPVLKFLLFGLICFVLFGAYNYILNFINYGNIAGSKAMLAAHRNHAGLKSVPADFIKYLFMFFDFTGFTWNATLGVKIIAFRDALLSKLGFFLVTDGLYSSDSAISNNKLLEPLMGMGILGFLVYLPCWIFSFIKPLFTRKKKDWIVFAFASLLLVTTLVMAYEIQFMTYSIRFLTSFCVVCAPVLAYSYCKKNNPLKFIIVFFAVFYLLFVSTNLWARAASRIVRYFKAGATVSKVREIAVCSGFYKSITKNPDLMTNYPIFNTSCVIRDKIKMLDKQNKILLFSNTSDTLLIIKMLDFKGYTVDVATAENIENVDFSKYNLLVTISDAQLSTSVRQFESANSNNLLIKNGIVCSYLDLNGKPIAKTSKNYPYEVFCEFSSYFFTKSGFKYYDEFSIDYTEGQRVMVLKYRFYENLNNPVIGKLKQ